MRFYILSLVYMAVISSCARTREEEEIFITSAEAATLIVACNIISDPSNAHPILKSFFDQCDPTISQNSESITKIHFDLAYQAFQQHTSKNIQYLFYMLYDITLFVCGAQHSFSYRIFKDISQTFFDTYHTFPVLSIRDRLYFLYNACGTTHEFSKIYDAGLFSYKINPPSSLDSMLKQAHSKWRLVTENVLASHPLHLPPRPILPPEQPNSETTCDLRILAQPAYTKIGDNWSMIFCPMLLTPSQANDNALTLLQNLIFIETFSAESVMKALLPGTPSPETTNLIEKIRSLDAQCQQQCGTNSLASRFLVIFTEILALKTSANFPNDHALLSSTLNALREHYGRKNPTHFELTLTNFHKLLLLQESHRLTYYLSHMSETHLLSSFLRFNKKPPKGSSRFNRERSLLSATTAICLKKDSVWHTASTKWSFLKNTTLSEYACQSLPQGCEGYLEQMLPQHPYVFNQKEIFHVIIDILSNTQDSCKSFTELLNTTPLPIINNPFPHTDITPLQPGSNSTEMHAQLLLAKLLATIHHQTLPLNLYVFKAIWLAEFHKIPEVTPNHNSISQYLKDLNACFCKAYALQAAAWEFSTNLTTAEITHLDTIKKISDPNLPSLLVWKNITSIWSKAGAYCSRQPMQIPPKLIPSLCEQFNIDLGKFLPCFEILNQIPPRSFHLVFSDAPSLITERSPLERVCLQVAQSSIRMPHSYCSFRQLLPERHLEVVTHYTHIRSALNACCLLQESVSHPDLSTLHVILLTMAISDKWSYSLIHKMLQGIPHTIHPINRILNAIEDTKHIATHIAASLSVMSHPLTALKQDVSVLLAPTSITNQHPETASQTQHHTNSMHLKAGSKATTLNPPHHPLSLTTEKQTSLSAATTQILYDTLYHPELFCSMISSLLTNFPHIFPAQPSELAKYPQGSAANSRMLQVYCYIKRSTEKVRFMLMSLLQIGAFIHSEHPPSKHTIKCLTQRYPASELILHRYCVKIFKIGYLMHYIRNTKMLPFYNLSCIEQSIEALHKKFPDLQNLLSHLFAYTSSNPPLIHHLCTDVSTLKAIEKTLSQPYHCDGKTCCLEQAIISPPKLCLGKRSASPTDLASKAEKTTDSHRPIHTLTDQVGGLPSHQALAPQDWLLPPNILQDYTPDSFSSPQPWTTVDAHESMWKEQAFPSDHTPLPSPHQHLSDFSSPLEHTDANAILQSTADKSEALGQAIGANIISLIKCLQDAQ